MARKKQNITNQLKSVLYQQFTDARGIKRHDIKEKRHEYAHHDLIYSQESLKTHLTRAKMYGEWLRNEHPEIRNINDITRENAIEYLQYRRDLGLSVRTVEADMSFINRVKVGKGQWSKDEILTKKEAEVPPRSKSSVRNNRGDKTASSVEYNENHVRIIEFGRAFGLRRSELVPNSQNTRYAAGQSSLYEKDNKVYAAVMGKGGKYRTIECLKSQESFIREEFGQHIKTVVELPTQEEYKEEYKKEEQFFKSISKNVRIHRECRQYYANEKLAEVEKDGREFELRMQNQLKSGNQKYTTNGREMERGHAQFVSRQLGHNRIYELKSYINVE